MPTSDWRLWIKKRVPYPLVCGIARAINHPWMEDLHRCERLVEYSWILAEVGKHHPPDGRILDFGYAGGYLAEGLCQFGPVVGVDFRETPRIAHPDFTYLRAPLRFPAGPGFDTIVCVSVIEHHLAFPATILDLQRRLTTDGQLLLTCPTGAVWQGFKGYRTIPLTALRSLEGLTQLCVFHRREGWWERGDQRVPTANTEYQVNAVACVRLTRPTTRPSPAA